MLMVVATLLHPVVRPPQRSLPASRGLSRLMWFTRLLVAGAARPFPDSMRVSAAVWDGWGWWGF
jgi:hypothetical protein